MPASPSWEDLLEEHRTSVLGDLWLGMLQHAVATITPHYPPHVYSETGEWNAHARENLVQTVAVDQLLEQGQIDYIVTTATNIETATALLQRTVRRTLGHTRRRTVIDNLLDRARSLRTMSPAAGAGATTADVVEAARDIAPLPRLRVRSDERAPAVYTTETLRKVLEVVEEHLGTNFSERDLARILEHVLTSYLPSALVQGDGRPSDASPDLTPDQEAVVADVLSNLLASMTPEQRTIVAMKLADHSDTVVAQHLGVSRPTAAKRYREATGRIQVGLADLSGRLQDAVLGELATHLEPYGDPNAARSAAADLSSGDAPAPAPSSFPTSQDDPS